jgi:hypothetical protein
VIPTLCDGVSFESKAFDTTNLPPEGDVETKEWLIRDAQRIVEGGVIYFSRLLHHNKNTRNIQVGHFSLDKGLHPPPQQLEATEKPTSSGGPSVLRQPVFIW